MPRLLLEQGESAMLNSGLAPWPPAGVSSGLDSYRAVWTPRFWDFSGLLRSVWAGHGGPARRVASTVPSSW